MSTERTTKTGWIRQALRNSNLNAKLVVPNYEQFLEETGSTASFKSFRENVYREKSKLKRNEDFPHSNGDDDGGAFADEEEFTSSKEATMHRDKEGNVVAEKQVVELKDPDQLLEDWGVDTAKWAVESGTVKTQTIYAKDKTGSLRYEDGRIQDGSLRYGGLKTQVVHHVRLKLYRKQLPREAVVPKPVTVNVEEPPRSTNKLPKQTPDYKSALVIGDAQIGFERNPKTGELDPFHDRRALDIMLQVAEYAQPDYLIVNGDMLDFTELSDKFLSGPEFAQTIQPAINELAWWLGRFKQVIHNPQKTEFVFIGGNHEDRLPRILERNQKSILGIRRADDTSGYEVNSVPHWLGLDSLDYQWRGDYPNERYWLNDNICISHSEKDRTNIQTIIKEMVHLEIIGHVHRSFQHIKTIHLRDRVQYAGLVSFGALSRIDDRVPSKGNRQDWQQGGGLVHFSPNKPFELPPHLVSVFIHEGQAFYDGKRFTADPQSEKTILNEVL